MFKGDKQKLRGHQQLDAVLPLKFRDYKRFRILDASLKKFMQDLGQLFIIVPDNEVELFRSEIKNNGYKIIPETAVVPEFKFFRNYPGWNKQQLIKLASTEIVGTDFYLPLDADIICIRPTGFSGLARNGRSYCLKLRLEQPAERFKRWYRDAEKILMKSGRKSVHIIGKSSPVLWEAISWLVSV